MYLKVKTVKKHIQSALTLLNYISQADTAESTISPDFEKTLKVAPNANHVDQSTTYS